MKNKVVYIILLLTIMMSFFQINLISVHGQDTKSLQKDKVAEQYVMPLLHAFQYGEKDDIYMKWVDSNKTKESEAFFDQLIDLWDGREAVSVRRTGETKRSAKGKVPSGITYSYEVTCIYDTAKVELTVSDSGKIDWINISVTPKVTGRFSDWRRFSPSQWLMTGVAAVEILFSIAMAFQCMKRKPRFWGFWLAFILLIYGGIAISTIKGLGISFYIYAMALPKVLYVEGLGMQIYVSLPIGAIIYCIMKSRKSKQGNIV